MTAEGKTFVRCLVQKLHDRLADIDRCFVRGAFVWEIRQGTQLGKRLLGTLKAFSKPRPVARTHRHFIRDTNDSKQMELTLKPPMRYLCDSSCRGSKKSQDCTKGKRTSKGVLMWYAFRRGPRTFLFVKLEGSKGMSIAHAIKAFKKYALKKDFDSGGYPYRAETKPRSEQNLSRNRKALSRWADSAFKSDGERKRALSRLDEKMAEYDRTVRVGNEMFVPWMILEREIRACA